MIGLAAFIAALAVQNGSDLTLYDRLYTGCARVAVGVHVTDEAQELGVANEERLATMADNRLRAARLYSAQSGLPVLGIEVVSVDGDGATPTPLELGFIGPY